jgi:hypothetical protein
MKNSFRNAAIAAIAMAIVAAAPATASTTIAWTQGGNIDNASQSFAAVNANSLTWGGTNTSYGTGITGPMAHSHFQPMNWNIDLHINGAWSTIFTQFLQGNQTSLVGLGPIGFASGSVDGIRIGCDVCSNQTYHQFSGASFTLGAVPEPTTWVMLVAGFGLVGATMRRRAAAAAIA